MLVGQASPRVITIAGMITAETIERVAERLAQLTFESRLPILAQISSSGGSIIAGWALHEMFLTCGAPVITVGYGYVGSAATVAFQAGVKRFLTANTTLMVHRVRLSLEEAAGESDWYKKQARELETMQAAIERLFVRRTGLPAKRIMEMCEKETELTAVRAVKAGFADKVVRGRRMPKPKKRRK